MTREEAAIKRYGSVRRAAKALGIPRSTFHDRLKGATPREEKFDLLDQLTDMLSGVADPPRRDSSPHMVVQPTDDIIPIILWSDWHWGETVDPEQVFGYNEFNVQIADQRVKKLISKTIGLARHESNSRKAVLWLGGDFISGYLHEELVATDWCTPLQAVNEVSKRLYNAILDLKAAFPELLICCSPGNHGRLRLSTTRPMAKNNTFASFDWLLYSNLKNWLGDGIEFLIPAEGDVLLDVLGTKFFFSHGQNLGVNGGNGEIGFIGPVMRARNRVASSLASMGLSFDVMVLGHFHTSTWLPGKGIIVNPCLVGYNEYGRVNRFTAEPAAQLLFFVHKDYGPCIPFEVYI